MRTVDRVLHAEHYQEKVVYDLDYLLESEQTRQRITPTSPPARYLIYFYFNRINIEIFSCANIFVLGGETCIYI